MSNDWPAGAPVNIMFYALLTHILAAEVDMDVGELWLTATDAHVYENQIEPLKEQLSREPYSLPQLKMLRLAPTVFDYNPEDFELVNYQHHPAIKFEVAK
jgi:thymidylate synthase